MNGWWDRDYRFGDQLAVCRGVLRRFEARTLRAPSAFPDTYPGLGAEITFIECIGDLSRVDVRVQRPGNGNPARDKIH